MGTIFTQFTINVRTDMWHHQVRLVFKDNPVHKGLKLCCEQDVQAILDLMHRIQHFDCWHPQYLPSLAT